jgi:hypothetical protein
MYKAENLTAWRLYHIELAEHRHSGLSRNVTDTDINPLNAELNPICHLLALLGGATLVVVSRLRVKLL